MNKINALLIEIATEGSEYDQIIDTMIAPNYHQKNELISEIAISFLGNQSSVNKAVTGNYFKYYFINVVRNQVHSSTSSFHKNVRMTTAGAVTSVTDIDIIDQEDDLEYKLLNELQNDLLNKTLDEVKVSWFEKEIFDLYYVSGKTYREIEFETGVDHCLAWVTVDKVKRRIKKQIEGSDIYKKKYE